MDLKLYITLIEYVRMEKEATALLSISLQKLRK